MASSRSTTQPPNAPCAAFFAGADSGGERAAAIYSLIGTAKLNGVDPEAWLRHVLANIADHPGSLYASGVQYVAAG